MKLCSICIARATRELLMFGQVSVYCGTLSAFFRGFQITPTMASAIPTTIIPAKAVWKPLAASVSVFAEHRSMVGLMDSVSANAI